MLSINRQDSREIRISLIVFAANYRSDFTQAIHMPDNNNTNNRSARELFSSLKTKVASKSSLLHKQSSSWFSKDEEHEPSLPSPEIINPFPVLEQPSRVLLKSLNKQRFDEQYVLSSNKRGVVCACSSRSEREQFLLIPVTETANNDDGAGEITSTRSNRQEMFYLKSYKFNRYLSSIYSDQVTTIDFTDNNEDWRDQKLGESEKWILMQSPHGGHFIISAQNEMNLACFRGEKSLEIGLKCDNDLSESWEVEFVSGKFCFVSSYDQKQLRCDLIGKLTLTEDKRGWEVWRFIETGGGKVRIVSWMHPFCIICDHEGKVSTAAVGKAQKGQDEWTVVKARSGHNGVVLTSVVCPQRILCHDKEESLSTTDVLENENGIWQLDAAHSQTYSLTSIHHGRSIGPYPLVSDNIKESDSFVVQQLIGDAGRVRLFHKSRGEYIVTSGEGKVTCSDKTPDDNDKSALWKMQATPFGGYTFTSESDNTFLAISSDENDPRLCTVSNNTDVKREIWGINPILPRAVSSDKIKTFALGTSVAVGTTIAMPFLMVGMVAALPAEATLAASILSVGLTTAEAAASVGAIGGEFCLAENCIIKIDWHL